MAGYIIKATIEDTHPPVWRRIVIPEKVNFKDLHEILQIAFQWGDCHAHEFAFPGTNLHVVMKDESDGEDEVDESKIQVDSFLTSNKSIRYIYDFGDDWRHKIVFEKKDPAYSSRFATILKYKGDSFLEDSGGAYAEEARVPFELGEANRRLAGMAFPVRKESKKSKDFFEYLALKEQWKLFPRMGHSDLKDITASFQMLWKMLGLPEREALLDEEELLRGLEILKEEVLSKMGEKVEQWWSFCDKKDSPERMELLKMACPKSSVELLSQLNKKGAREYCKYIGAAAADMGDVRQCAQAFWEELERHPEYLAYMFEWEGMESLLDFVQAPNGACSKIPGDEAMARAISLGLFDVSQETVNRRQYIALHQTREAEQLLGCYKRPGWKRRCEECGRRMEACFRTLHLHNAMEMDVFCEKYQEYFGGVSRDEILRMAYLGGTFCQALQTAERTDGVAYIAEFYIDMNNMIDRQKQAGIDIGYRAFSEQERERALAGYGELYPAWGDYYGYLTYFYRVEDEITLRWLQMQYQQVKNGEGADALWENARDSKMLEGIESYVNLWSNCFGVCLTTGIPMLMGYSREEYAKIKGISPTELEIYRNVEFVKKITRTTHLYEMPQEFQLRLYYAAQKAEYPDGEDGIQELNALLQESGGENNEIMFLIADKLLNLDEAERAEGYVKKLRKELPKDESLKEIEQMIRDLARFEEEDLTARDIIEEQKLKSQTDTFRREQPKVGRNDPCPCGSGKKYKKCCGK